MSNLKAFIVFVASVLLVYGGVNYYLYRRIMQGIALSGGPRTALQILLMALVLAYPLGRALGGDSAPARALIWAGAFWLGMMTYGFIFALAVDGIRLMDLLTGWLPTFVTLNRLWAGRLIVAFGFVLIGSLMLGGYLAALNPRVHEIHLQVPGLSPERSPYRIAAFADLHLGVLVGRDNLERLVHRVNDLRPDLILIGGDLVDEPPGRLTWAVEPLSRLSAPDGVWAVTGNHEFYSGPEDCVEFARLCGILMPRDTAQVVGNAVGIVFLDDITGSAQFRRPTVPIDRLVKTLPEELPVILLHHSPRRMVEASQAGVDLMLSGHTHRGQLWPLGCIARAVYGVDTGYTRFGAMHFYLTTGVGTWGPPVRVGAAPEILLITLTSGPSRE